jgi:hypothetical protein
VSWERAIIEGPRGAPTVIFRDTRDVELSGLVFTRASPQYVLLEGARNCLIGICLDDSTNGAVVTRNLVRRVGSDAVQTHGGSNNRVENNLLDPGEGRPAAVLFQAAPADTNPSNAQTGNTVVRNIILSSNRDPKLLVRYNGGAPYEAANLYANATGPVALPDAPVTDRQPVLGDPALARSSPQTHYEAAQAAAVAAFGFKWIDPAQAGPRPLPAW